jgi:hypothetical protein
MMLFEGGGAFLPKRTKGRSARNGRAIHHHLSALGHLPAVEMENETRKSPIEVKKEALVKRQYLFGRDFIFGMDLLQHRT